MSIKFEPKGRYIVVTMSQRGTFNQPFELAGTLDLAVHKQDVSYGKTESSAIYDRERNRWIYDNSAYSLYPNLWKDQKKTVENVWHG